jgi:DNA-binding MarR family transcriptional regulator
MGQLSECIEVAPRTMTSTVELMERDGLVHRSPDPGDRRATVVTITDKGREAFAEGRRMKASVVADLFDVLDDDERTDFYEILAKLGTAVDVEVGGSSLAGEIRKKAAARV